MTKVNKFKQGDSSFKKSQPKIQSAKTFKSHQGPSKGSGLPNLSQLKQNLIEGLERKKKVDSHYRDHLTTLKEKTKGLTSMESYATAAVTQSSNFETSNLYSEIPKDIEDESDPNAKQMAQSRRAFYKELKKVIDNADVVL